MTVLEVAITKELIRAVHREDGRMVTSWEGWFALDGERYYAGSWPLDAKLQAEDELDRLAYAYLTQRQQSAPTANRADQDQDDEAELLPPPDPTIPFNGAGGPTPDWQPTLDQLTLAYQRIVETYPDGFLQQTSKGSKTLDVAGRAKKALQALQDRHWLILDDGSLIIAGSAGYYRVQDDSCARVLAPLDPNGTRTDPSVWLPSSTTSKTGRRSPQTCPGFFNHAGMCYHALARELLRLSQVLAEQEAFAAVDATVFGGSCFTAALTQQPVCLQAGQHGLIVQAGAVRAEVVSEEHFGQSGVQLSPAAFAAFWHAYQEVVRTLISEQRQATAQIWLSPTAHEVHVVVVDADFQYRLAA